MVVRATGRRSEQASDQARLEDAPVLDVKGLSVAYRGSDGESNTVVWDLDFALHRRRISGLAGESGCGKSTAALGAIGYPMPNMQVLDGRSLLGGVDLIGLDFGSLQ
ncbi:MAG TPA: hypothetical protein VNT22_01675, partial [Baekduia sp.]|nr:hypothetical protein [Baekduia sp.]